MDQQSELTRREALRRAGLLAGVVVVGGPTVLSACSKSLDKSSSGSSGGKNKAPVLLGIVDSFTGPVRRLGRIPDRRAPSWPWPSSTPPAASSAAARSRSASGTTPPSPTSAPGAPGS